MFFKLVFEDINSHPTTTRGIVVNCTFWCIFMPGPIQDPYVKSNTTKGDINKPEAEPHTRTVYIALPLVGVNRYLSLDDFLKNIFLWLGSVENPDSSAWKIQSASSASARKPLLFSISSFCEDFRFSWTNPILPALFKWDHPVLARF